MARPHRTIRVLATDRTWRAVSALVDAAQRADVTLVPVAPVAAEDDCCHTPAPTTEVALVDATTPDTLTESIRGASAAGWTRVIALGATTESAALAAFSAGATGLLIHQRDTAIKGPLPTGVHDLSERELEVLRMVADGQSNKAIGATLSLSALTVKSHLARIGRKLGTGERAHMVMIALRAGIIS